MPYSKEKTREYFQTHNTPNVCECGGSFKKYFIKSHQSTQKHIAFEKLQQAEKKKAKKQTTADVLKELQLTIKNIQEQLINTKSNNNILIQNPTE
jgi:hypothetical protein